MGAVIPPANVLGLHWQPQHKGRVLMPVQPVQTTAALVRFTKRDLTRAVEAVFRAGLPITEFRARVKLPFAKGFKTIITSRKVNRRFKFTDCTTRKVRVYPVVIRSEASGAAPLPHVMRVVA